MISLELKFFFISIIGVIYVSLTNPILKVNFDSIKTFLEVLINITLVLVGSFILSCIWDYLAVKSEQWYYTKEKTKKRLLKSLKIPPDGNGDIPFYNASNTLIAKGYSKILFTRYSAIVEFTPENLIRENIRFKYGGKWIESKDKSRTYITDGIGIEDSIQGMYYILLDSLQMQNQKSFY